MQGEPAQGVRGKLPHCRVGRSVRFRLDKILAAIHEDVQ